MLPATYGSKILVAEDDFMMAYLHIKKNLKKNEQKPKQKQIID